MNITVPQPEVLLAATMRIVAALMVLPIFGHRSVPALARIGLGAAMTWLLVAAGSIRAQPPASLAGFALGLGSETLLGLLLGFSASLIFWTMTMAGELIGLQIGWNFGATLHMSFENSSAPTGQFYNIFGTLIFLSIGGHRLALTALADTFAVVPAFGLTLNTIRTDFVVNLGGALFRQALQLALPAVGTLILIEVALGFLSRVLPQLNAWVFGLPIKIAAGLLAIWISLPVVLVLLQHWLTQAAGSLGLVVH